MVKAYTKNPVGAHYGLGDWLLQRLTAVVMAAYTIVFVGCLLIEPPTTYAAWKEMFSGSLLRIFTTLFIVALLYHAWVGMRDILMDYLHAAGVRLVAEVAVALALLLYLIWSASVLWGR